MRWLFGGPRDIEEPWYRRWWTWTTSHKRYIFIVLLLINGQFNAMGEEYRQAYGISVDIRPILASVPVVNWFIRFEQDTTAGPELKPEFQPTAEPTATPAPIVLNAGSILHNQPNMDSLESAPIPSDVGDSRVGGLQFQVIGHYGEPGDSLLEGIPDWCYCYQVRAGTLEGWVLRSSLPYTDEELRAILLAPDVPNRKP